MTDELNQVFREPVSGLSYRIRRPDQVTGQAAPCLLLLHGVGASEAGLVDVARRMDPRLAVVLVRGPLAFAPAQFGWFQVGFTPSGPVINAEQAELARVKLAEFIRQLAETQGVDPRRVWIAGFSQGGIMSASVALTAPTAVAGFGILSGRILREVLPKAAPAAALGKLQAFVSHGTDDQVLGIHFGRQSRETLSGLGVPLEYHEYAAGHELNREMIGDFSKWLHQQLGE